MEAGTRDRGHFTLCTLTILLTGGLGGGGEGGGEGGGVREGGGGGARTLYGYFLMLPPDKLHTFVIPRQIRTYRQCTMSQRMHYRVSFSDTAARQTSI